MEEAARRLAQRCSVTARTLAPVGTPLNAREMQVLTGISQGRTAVAIGRAIGLSADSVKGYGVSMRHKLGAISNPNAILLACRAGVLK